MADENTPLKPIELATELTIAWLSNPNTRANADEALAFLNAMRGAIGEVTAISQVTEQPATAEGQTQFTPAVTVRKSLASKDHIISLIDGKPYRTLTRHLSAQGLTPDEYRTRYNLKPNYPMTAPSYSEQRRAMAKKIGLGRKPGMKRPTRAQK